MESGDNQREKIEVTADFDFAAHASQAVDNYVQVRPLYDDFSSIVESILREAVDQAQVVVHSIESRAKDPDSFRKKASLPSSRDPNEPRYSSPTDQITD